MLVVVPGRRAQTQAVVVSSGAESWWSVHVMLVLAEDRVGISRSMSVEVHPIRVCSIAHGGVAGFWSTASASLALHQENSL